MSIRYAFYNIGKIMSKKVVVLLGAAVVVGGILLFRGHDQKKDVVDQNQQNTTTTTTTNQSISTENHEKHEGNIRELKVQDAHSEILEAISNGEKTIAKISPEDAKKELERRANDPSFSKEPEVNIHNLPFDVLVLIAKSATSLAGISPKQATNEIAIRYVSLDKDDLTFSDLLFLYRNYDEQNAINKWAENEDVEDIEKFMKEQADLDPSSVEAFVYGVKHLKSNHDEAKQYLKRFATNVNSKLTEPLDELQKNSLDELTKDIDNLK